MYSPPRVDVSVDGTEGERTSSFGSRQEPEENAVPLPLFDHVGILIQSVSFTDEFSREGKIGLHAR